jgi:hypothetical protein
MNGFAETMVNMYRHVGLIPRGPAGGNYTYVMIGDPAASFFAAAWHKGIRNWDAETAYAGLRKNAFPGGLRDHMAIEAGMLTREETVHALERMRSNVRHAKASSIGLTLYPTYPKGAFKSCAMIPYRYQNGGDWCWFGGRMIQQLIRQGLIQDAYHELKPMVTRVQRVGDFHEWWSPDNQPRGSAQFRGSAGVLALSIEMLQTWARQNETVSEP